MEEFTFEQVRMKPELLARRTTNLATEIVKAYAHTIDPGEALKAEEEKLRREEDKRQRAWYTQHPRCSSKPASTARAWR